MANKFEIWNFLMTFMNENIAEGDAFIFYCIFEGENVFKINQFKFYFFKKWTVDEYTLSLTLRLKYDEIPGRGPWNRSWSQTRAQAWAKLAQPAFSSNKKYSVPVFFKPAHGGNSRNQASDYLPYQQAHHDGLALRTTNLGVGSRKFRATSFWYRQLIGNKLQNTPAKYLIGVLRTLC